jgi:hypothetical protein
MGLEGLHETEPQLDDGGPPTPALAGRALTSNLHPL